MSYKFFCDCVSWPRSKVHCDGGLCDMVDQNIELSRRTFLRHVDRRDLERLEQGMGYAKHHSQGLTMARDWHVSYHRSKLFGRRVYYFQYSGIEYVFTPDGRVSA